MSRHHVPYMRLQEQAQRLSSAMLDLLFPPRCAVCGRPSTGPICDACCRSFSPLGPVVCPQCSLPVDIPGPCSRCQHDPPAFRRVMSGFRYEGALRKSILALKYRNKRALAVPLVNTLPDGVRPPDGCRICGVPMHPERLKARGFNHAQLLADGVADRWGVDSPSAHPAYTPPGRSGVRGQIGECERLFLGGPERGVRKDSGSCGRRLYHRGNP